MSIWKLGSFFSLLQICSNKPSFLWTCVPFSTLPQFHLQVLLSYQQPEAFLLFLVFCSSCFASLIPSLWLSTSLENFQRLCLHLWAVFITRVRIINAVAFCYCCCSCCRCFLARVCVLIATDAVLSREQLCLWHCCSLSCVRFQRAYIQCG